MERFNKKETKDYELHFRVQFLSIVEILKIVLVKMKKEKRGKIIFVLSSVIFSKSLCALYKTVAAGDS